MAGLQVYYKFEFGIFDMEVPLCVYRRLLNPKGREAGEKERDEMTNRVQWGYCRCLKWAVVAGSGQAV